jgi:hypothetical protein
MIDEHKWREEYKRLCCELLGMDKFEAERHFQGAKEFDYGYSPIWYIREEILNGFVKAKGETCSDNK